MSPVVINELATLMGNTLLQNSLERINLNSPSCYSIIADETTYVVNCEQLNVSIRWVNDDYKVFEDPLGLFCLPNTKADT